MLHVDRRSKKANPKRKLNKRREPEIKIEYSDSIPAPGPSPD